MTAVLFAMVGVTLRQQTARGRGWAWVPSPVSAGIFVLAFFGLASASSPRHRWTA